KSTKQLVSTGIPMAIMVTITITALLYLAIWQNLVQKLLNPSWMAENGLVDTLSIVVQIIVAFVLVYLAIALVRMGVKNVREARTGAEAGAAEPADD
ncbi:MAG: carbon starvation protein A, partial [Halodesulfurarchaeum sp.]